MKKKKKTIKIEKQTNIQNTGNFFINNQTVNQNYYNQNGEEMKYKTNEERKKWRKIKQFIIKFAKIVFIVYLWFLN